MPLESILGPLASIIDKIIPDKAARERAKLELLELQGSQELDAVQARLSAIVAITRPTWLGSFLFPR